MRSEFLKNMKKGENILDAMHRRLPVGTLLMFSDKSNNAGRLVRVVGHSSKGISVQALRGELINVYGELTDSPLLVDPNILYLLKFPHLKEVV